MQIVLEKFQKADFDLYYALVSEERVMAQITERAIPLEEAEINFHSLLKRNQQAEKIGSYKIYDQQTLEYIGLGHITPDDDLSGEAELGYMILPQYWGKGYGSEIARVLLVKAGEAGMTSLKAIIDPDNIPSRRILQKHGFISEKIGEIDGLPAEILRKSLNAE